jgi:hypothetical protein
MAGSWVPYTEGATSDSSHNAMREGQIQSTRVLQQPVSKPLVLGTEEEWQIQTSECCNGA